MSWYALRLHMTGVLFISLLSCNVGFAQALTSTSTTSVVATSTGSSVPRSDGVVDCFDYYHPNSVRVALTAATSSISSGTSIRFTGTLTNDNPYPVVDAALYIKVLRPHTVTVAGKTSIGFDVVDQLFVRDGIVVPARGTVPVSFSWNIPQYSLAGEYQLVPHVVVAKKYSLLGTPAVDTTVGTTTRFFVTSNRKAGVSFQKYTIKVTNKPYAWATTTLRIAATSSPVVSATVLNDGKETAPISVTWYLYAGNALKQGNLLDEQLATSTLTSRKKKVVSYKLVDTAHAEYVLVGELQWGDSKSYLDLHIVRDQAGQLVVDFPAVDMFPLAQGQPATLFSCVHAAGTKLLPSERLELVLSDRSGMPIHTYTYSDGGGSNVFGVAEQFVPDRDYGFYALNTRVYEGNTLVDESHSVYDCMEINPSLCPKEKESITSSLMGLVTRNATIIWISILGVLLVGVGVGTKVRRK